MDGEESIKMNGTPPVDEEMMRNRKKRTKEGFLKFCQVVLEHERYDEMIREEKMSLTANENKAPSDQITDTSIENSTFDESDLNADGWNANGGVNDVGGIGLGVGGVGGIGEEGGGGGGGGGGADSFNSVTCFCGKPFAGRPMIECSGCLTWLHMSCAKVKRKNIPEFYFCEKCKATGTATNSSGEEGSGSIVGGSSLGGGVGGSGGGSGGGVGAENNSTSSNNTNINLNNNLSTKMINTNPMDLSQLQIVNVKPRKQSKLMSKKSATTNNNNNNNNRMMNSSDNIKNINASDNKFVNKKSSPMNGKLKKIRKMSPTKKFRQQLTTTTTNTTPTTSPSAKALMMNNTATASTLMAQVQLIDAPSTKEQSTNMLLKSPTNNNNNNNNNIYNTAAIETSVSATTTTAATTNSNTTTTQLQQTNTQLITTTPTTPTPPATTANVLENTTNGQDGQEKYNSNKRLKVL